MPPKYLSRDETYPHNIIRFLIYHYCYYLEMFFRAQGEGGIYLKITDMLDKIVLILYFITKGD